MNKPITPIPRFTSDEEERAYWEEHDSTEHLDWSQATKAVLPNLKPSTKTISGSLAQRPESGPDGS